jgi:DHA2 family lincomycin resistance protein-like MFS transporter
LLPLGFLLIALFSAALALFISTGSAVLLALLYIPVIGGSALIIGPVQSLALSHLAREEHPHGVTILSTGFQIAGCFGASLFTGVYYGVMTAANGNAVTGFLAAGFLAAAFGLAGLAFALRMNRY